MRNANFPGAAATAAALMAVMLTACAPFPEKPSPEKPEVKASPATEMPTAASASRYRTIDDGHYMIGPVPRGYLTGANARALVHYNGPDAPGTIVVDPYARRLYLVLKGGLAIRYGVAVGRDGKGYAGNAVIRRKAEWPGWRPTKHMLRTEPDRYGDYAEGLKGGPYNPLGARALYLYHHGRDTYYRIHGTSNPSSIGRATSAGCIRLFNQDIIDLYSRVPVNSRVHVRTRAESRALEGRFIQAQDGLLEPVHEHDVVVHGPKARKILMTKTDKAAEALAAKLVAEGHARPQARTRATDTAALDPM